MRSRYIVIILSVIFLILTGCDNSQYLAETGESLSDHKTKMDPVSIEVQNSTSFSTPHDVLNIISMAVDENANVYAAEFHGAVSQYTSDGEFIQNYPAAENLCALRYADGYIYGFQEQTKDILRINVKTGEPEIIYADLDVWQISALEIFGDNVYLIVIPSFSSTEYEMSDDYYIDYNERLLQIDCETGKMTEIREIGNPITLYLNREHQLYVYAHPDEQYVLFRYDLEKQKTEMISAMDDVGYLFSFAYENETIVFLSSAGGVRAKKMPDGLIYTVSNNTPVTYHGGCFTAYGHTLLYLEEGADADINETEAHDDVELYNLIKTLNMDSEFVSLVREGEPTSEEIEGTIIISVPFRNEYFDTSYMNEKCKIKPIFTTQPGDWDEYLEFYASLMAGDDEIDIYILALDRPEVQTLREEGGYVALNDSSAIRAYQDNAFDWVSENMTSKNGDIWMLPLQYPMEILWYVPDHFEELGLKTEDVSTLDGFFDTMQKLNEQPSPYIACTWDFTLAEDVWCRQYESVYNDYDNGMINFNNDIYRHLFQRMWAGWDVKKEGHPVLSSQIEGLKDSPRYDAERMVFSIENLNSHIYNTGDDIVKWRALPLPKISESVEGNIAGCMCAVVNPYSKNKELAISYLETAAGDMLSSMMSPNFTLKDLSAYVNHYNMEIPVYRDIYEIFKNVIPNKRSFPSSERLDIALKYQAGELTLDEAINEIDRRAKFFAGE